MILKEIAGVFNVQELEEPFNDCEEDCQSLQCSGVGGAF